MLLRRVARGRTVVLGRLLRSSWWLSEPADASVRPGHVRTSRLLSA
ncbi:hypothetical protein T261_0338 [Streptomyces lydicus]|nr:hypothetical protein T261_0338 [Streptomyces lydicus]